MRVKICGITTYKDAITAIEAGADALGFVFYPSSPRYITPETAHGIIRNLPPFVEKVGLFVNENAKSINDAAQRSGVTLLQIHFEAKESLYSALEKPYLRVIRAQSPSDLRIHQEEYRLIDAYCDAYGGMGKALNLEWFEGIDCSKIILAGGLRPDNVGLTCNYGFYGVDVSSGVEHAKGVKSFDKMISFIREAKKTC